MRRIFTAISLPLFALSALAQVQVDPLSQVNWAKSTGSGAPTGRQCPTTVTATTHASSNLLTGVSSFSGVALGQTVVGTGVASGAIVTGVLGSTSILELSAASSATATESVALYSYGLQYTDTTNNAQYFCSSSGWVASSASGGVTPSPQFSVFYQPNSGTSGAAVGDPNVTTDGSGDVALITAVGKAIGGFRYAKQYQTGGGNNGIANATANNQLVVADPSYGTTEQPLTSSFSATGLHVSDYRAGSQTDFFHDPGLPWLDQYNSNLAKNLYCLFDSVSSASAALVAHDCWNMTHNDNSPGWNWGSGGVGPDGWLIQSSAVVANNTQNSGNQISFTSNSMTTGLGDRVAGNFLTSSWGGRTGGGDEGVVGLRVQVNEATSYQGWFTAKISSASAPYLTLGLFSAQPFDNFANLGQGQYLIDLGTCSAYPCTAPYTGTAATGVLSVANGFGVSVATLGTSSLPVSNAWGTLQANVAPAQQNTFPFGTSTTFNVVLTSGAVDTVHKFCFISQFHECTIPTAVGTPSGGVQSVTINGRSGHAVGSSWLQGGMAGYVLEPSAYTQFPVYPNALRFPLDVFGSTANNQIIVGSFNSGVVQGGLPIRLATCTITSLTNSGTTVSFATASSSACTDVPQDNLGQYPGATILITEASDSAFNALCTAMTINSGVTSGTCTIAGLTGSHTSATAAAYLTQNSIASNSFNLWPSVQILDVQDEGVSPPAVDGKITIEPTLSFATNDIVEQTHNFAGGYAAVTTLTNTQNPLSGNAGISAIVQGPGAVGGGGSASSPSMIAAFNNNPNTYYQGYGGINMPENGLTIRGPSNIGINFSDYPLTGLINVPGNGLQVNNPNFCEPLFALGSRAGGGSNASITYCPYQNTMSFTSLGGITMTSPGGITLNGATTLANGSALGTPASGVITNLTGTCSSCGVTGAPIAPTTATLTSAAPAVSAGQVGFGGTVVASSFCGSLASSTGCLVINVAGTTRYVPYY